MTRLLLTWIGFTILQFGTPRSPGAAELRTGGECTRIVPQLEALSNAVLARQASRSNELWGTHAPPFAPAEPARLRLASLRDEPAPREPARRGPAAQPSFLPEARAPPA